MHLINKRFVVKIETVTEKLSLIISSTTFSDNNNRNSLFIVSFQPTRLIFPYSKLLYKNIINLRIVPYFLYYNPFNPSILIVKMGRKNSNLLSTIDRIFLLHVFLIYKHNFRPSKLKLERKNCQWQYFQHFLIIITEIYCLSCQLIRLIFPYYSKFPIRNMILNFLAVKMGREISNFRRKNLPKTIDISTISDRSIRFSRRLRHI